MYGMRSLNATEVAAGADWSAKKQGAMQLGAIGVTIVISLVGGLIAGKMGLREQSLSNNFIYLLRKMNSASKSQHH